MMAAFHLVFLALVVLVSPTMALQCLTCSGTTGCVTDPTNEPNYKTDCKQGNDICCTIVRQEYNEEPGSIVSFARSCQPNCTEIGYTEVPDTTHTFYLTYCNTPLCNSGEGNSELGSSGGGGGNVISGIAGQPSAGQQIVAIPLLIIAAVWAVVRLHQE